MRKFTLLIAIFALSVLTLISCSDGEEVPEGLEIVTVSKEEGFKLYCPEGWTLINSKLDTDRPVFGAKMSAFNNISMTFTEANMPAGLAEAADKNASLGAIDAYFKASLKEFPEDMEVTVVTSPVLSNFGNAPEAYKCVYTYKYETYNFACMQYFVRNSADFYIFTYTSYGDVNDEESDYRVHLEKIELAIKSFEFTEKSGGEGEDLSKYEKDESGYYLVSDKKIAGFDLYLPEGVSVIVSDAFVTAKMSESAVIYLGKATATGVQINQYWENRKKELDRFADSITEIEVNKINESGKEKCVTLGDLADNRVASYEFTYEIGGTVYHVYQVMGVTSFDGYVFTYTATEEEYAKHLDTVKAILAKVKF